MKYDGQVPHLAWDVAKRISITLHVERNPVTGAAVVILELRGGSPCMEQVFSM